MRIRVWALAGAVCLLIAGCGRGPASPRPETPSSVRTIQIRALDSLRFEPAELTVTAGETVRFVVTNGGVGHHEFVLGSEDVQTGHESGDHTGHGGPEALASLDLPAREVRDATVTFEEPGEVLFGCHVEGHYQAGMVGTVTVEAV